jgi:chromosome segregation ATPase
MIQLTKTDPPIKYEEDKSDPKRIRFSLYPIKDVHTEEHALSAMKWLRNSLRNVTVQIRWLGKPNLNDLPEKIPEIAIIANLREEIGKLESYIGELEAEIKALTHQSKLETSQETKKLKKELLKDEQVAHYKSLYEKKVEEVKKLRQDISSLITKLHQGKNPVVNNLEKL